MEGKQRGNQRDLLLICHNRKSTESKLYINTSRLEILLYCLEYEYKHTEEMVKKNCKAENGGRVGGGLVAKSCLTLCNPMDCNLSVRLLCPWNSPAKNTGVDSHCLL